MLKPDLGPLTISYGEIPLEVTNTSHAIKIPLPKKSASYFALGPAGNEVRFKLVEFHFHVPAEHANVPGVANPVAEVHFVHDGPGGAAAIAILLTLSKEDNENLAPLIAAIPKTPLCGSVNSGLFNLAKLVGVAKPSRFIEYGGSLTTPDCTKVRWFVLSTTIAISQRQLNVLNIFGGNARPLQTSTATYCWPAGQSCRSK
jgi:carbonic anhydrase